MTWWKGGRDNQYHYSLRCRGDGGVEGKVAVDVAEIARGFGGGGHAAASGFSAHLPPWELATDEGVAEMISLVEHLEKLGMGFEED